MQKTGSQISRDDMQHHPNVEWRRVPGKGRGVFARRDMKAGEIVEAAPLNRFPGEIDTDARRHSPALQYMFNWGPGECAYVCGLVVLYNHSPAPNVRIDDGPDPDVALVIALHDIHAGDELCFDYGELWFEPV